MLIAWSKIGHRPERHIAAVRLAASYNCLLHCVSPQVDPKPAWPPVYRCRLSEEERPSSEVVQRLTLGTPSRTHELKISP